MSPAPNEQLDAYKTHQRQNHSERDIEAHALLSCATYLETARDPGVDIEEYTAALKLNQRLWTIFQIALCDPENPLPAELKSLLLNLSRYVDQTSFKAIAARNPELLKSLIDINRHIAVGLSKKPAGAQAAQSSAQPSVMPSTPLSVTTA